MSNLQANLCWKIGDVTVTRVVEHSASLPASGFFSAATHEQLEKHAEWLKPWSLDDDDKLTISIHALCVESEGRKIVVDTCVGQRPLPDPYSALANDGAFLAALTDAGFAPETVDTVICTHMHFDHVGWNTIFVDGKWVPTFPKARYLMAQREYDHWIAASEEERFAASAITFDDAVLPLFDAGVVDLVEVDHQVTGDVALEHTPGHTPGHVSVRIRSQGEVAIITGDCMHHAVQLAEPTWHLHVDTDPHESTATRQRIVAECCDQPVLVIGTHFPPPTAGHVVSTPDGARFQPLA
jgi:glyoxylase-like metal-dependent hydrolase (beta-lactamase superfamily II)